MKSYAYECAECGAEATLDDEGAISRTCTHSGSVFANMEATVTLATAGQQLIATKMFEQGVAFIEAYALLAKDPRGEPREYVALHLLCQGTELVLKALLLFADYDKYKPTLKNLRHYLRKALASVKQCYPLDEWDVVAVAEFDALSELYEKHWLRYANEYQVFIPPSAIVVENFVRELAKLMELGFKRKSDEQ